MKRITRTFLLALATFAVGCAGPFDQCVKPYTSQVTWTGTYTELGDVVGAFLLCDPTFNGGDAPVCALESLNQLETTLGPDGKAIVDCLVAYYEGAGTAKQKAAAKAVGAKRNVNRQACIGRKPLSLRSPGDSTVPKRPTAVNGSNAIPGDRLPGIAAGRMDPAQAPAAVQFSYAGENPGVALARCQRACGGRDALAPPGDCLCLHENKRDQRQSHWVSL